MRNLWRGRVGKHYTLLHTVETGTNEAGVCPPGRQAATSIDELVFSSVRYLFNYTYRDSLAPSPRPSPPYPKPTPPTSRDSRSAISEIERTTDRIEICLIDWLCAFRTQDRGLMVPIRNAPSPLPSMESREIRELLGGFLEVLSSSLDGNVLAYAFRSICFGSECLIPFGRHPKNGFGKNKSRLVHLLRLLVIDGRCWTAARGFCLMRRQRGRRSRERRGGRRSTSERVFHVFTRARRGFC